MRLLDLIHKHEKVKAATAISAIPATSLSEKAPTIATVATIAIANPIDIKLIRTWLFSIEEPEEDHHLLIDKCINDPKAMEYFLKHANAEFNQE